MIPSRRFWQYNLNYLWLTSGSHASFCTNKLDFKVAFIYGDPPLYGQVP